MNKRKLPLCLVSSFIATIAMTACGSKVSSDPKAIVSLTGYDGNEVSVGIDNVYFDQLDSSSGISKFYNAMLEVLIRYEYQNSNSALWKTADKPSSTYSAIEASAKEKLDGLKEKARESAKSNGTSYSKEWNNILTEKGVENEKELKQKLIYELEKEEVEDWYFKKNEEALLKEYLGLVGGSAPASYPYHIRHILASISSGSSDFYSGTISESEALKLFTITKALRDGKETFGEIATKTPSDDSGSAKGGLKGSVGIMDTSTDFVNEFKLGIYAYDAIYSADRSATATAAGLGLAEEVNGVKVSDKLDEIGLAYVPYGVFEKLNEFKDVDKDDEGHEVNNGNSKYFPRNIYWNKYLNRHNVFVITNNAMQNAYDDPAKTIYEDVRGDNVTANDVDANIVAAADGKCGFRYVEGLSNSADQLILTDEQGRPIVCVRSSHGIHFMIIEKSIFDANVEAYYSTLTPGEEGYNEDSFVGFVDATSKSVFDERAEIIKDKIVNFDSTYDYRVYEYFLAEENNLSFAIDGTEIDLSEKVARYIDSQREANVWNKAKSMNETWRTYLELLEVQQANRIAERLVPELCALRFHDANAIDNLGERTNEAYKEGGPCYYAK